MDDIKQSQYYPPSRTGSGSGWIIGAVIVFIVLLLITLLSLSGAPSGDGTQTTADPAAASSTAPATGTEPATPATTGE
ncbi:hypothetical protein [Ruegeria sp. HKCCD8929]|uniref:hypothetical protein n=1 Tax=Ruegeria sp. HKCCD8929 TaxID=2683006 RepID=UPI0014884602|nr:hypothetical protein [Ruegeria sp. HKCCD8929]